ncbi:stage 0 sporulation regulatory protein [Evansella caseinilytica]|uniref:Stage 0 sporulation regulatory protein n=1 Tax=Evansella caseinilytica TaxID=1503961 RepID=A0A1H3NMU0_9BACI|nr:aspartyl-phosphate phosphatase Spo0E family protein [Evansella caseinilytica]SDY89735.1 stage 0 sporulation regulatory protein [Evansella caseinilytica]
MSLTNEIEQKRKELLLIVNKNGLSSEDTLRCSKELDKLILNYQKKLVTAN